MLEAEAAFSWPPNSRMEGPGLEDFPEQRCQGCLWTVSSYCWPVRAISGLCSQRFPDVGSLSFRGRDLSGSLPRGPLHEIWVQPSLLSSGHGCDPHSVPRVWAERLCAFVSVESMVLLRPGPWHDPFSLSKGILLTVQAPLMADPSHVAYTLTNGNTGGKLPP